MIGYVYGIQCGQLIKVGAANDLRRRMHTFRLYNPNPLKIVLRREVKENYWVEKRMHRLLVEHAIGREWFNCSAEEVRDAFDVAFKELVEQRHLIVGTPRGWTMGADLQTNAGNVLAVPRHSYSRFLCNSFKTGLLPGQNNGKINI